MTEEQMEIVAQARIIVVRKFRNKEGGYDRPDSPGDQWYNPNEWDDNGNYFGPPKPMLPVPIQREASESIQNNEQGEIDSPTPEQTVTVEKLLRAGNSLRLVASKTGMTIGKVQRLKAKLKISE